jgi:hypothetical protein
MSPVFALTVGVLTFCVGKAAGVSAKEPSQPLRTALGVAMGSMIANVIVTSIAILWFQNYKTMPGDFLLCAISTILLGLLSSIPAYFVGRLMSPTAGKTRVIAAAMVGSVVATPCALLLPVVLLLSWIYLLPILR